MKQRSLSPMIFVLAVLAFLIGSAIPASAGGVLDSRSQRSTLEASLGLRFTKPLPKNMVAGQRIQAVVTDPAKLAGFGHAGVKRNDKVDLIVGPSDRQFSVAQGGGSQVRNFTMDDKGAVRLLPIDDGSRQRVPAKMVPAPLTDQGLKGGMQKGQSLPK